MNRSQKPTSRPARCDVWERLSQRLMKQAECDERHSNAAIIRRMRQTYFADVEALAKSGTVKLPEMPGASTDKNVT